MAMTMAALHSIRLRRAHSLSYTLLEHSFRGYKTQPLSSISNSRLLPAPAATTQLMQRPFTSTTSLFRRAFDSDPDDVGPDTLFEGCDYKHWLITVDFSRDCNVSREQMIDTYVSIAAQVFGSVQEAMKRIYALSTTTYQGFQVECPEEISEKFKRVPQVSFVLPDSYVDPVNKEYGGDKYVNGEVYPRSPQVQYGSRSNGGMQLREQNYGLPLQQNVPPPRNIYRPPPQQNQQNYGLSLQQNYRTPQQGYTPQPHQSFRSPPLKSYMPKTRGSYGNSSDIPIYPDNTTGHDGKRGFMQDGNYGSSQNGPFGPAPSYQGNFNRDQLESDSAQGQGKLQSLAQPSPWGLMREANYRSSQDGPFGQVPSYQGNSNRAELQTDRSRGQGKRESHAQPGQRRFSQDANSRSSQNRFFGQAPSFQSDFNRAELEFDSAYGREKLQSKAQDGPFGQVPSYQGNSNRAELQTDHARGQGKRESHAQPGQRCFSQDANNRSSQNRFFGQAPSFQSDFNRAELEFDSAYGREKLQSKAQDGPFGQVPSYQGNSNRVELQTDHARGQGKLESHAQPGQRRFLQDANNRSSQNVFFGQTPSQSDFNRAELEFDSAYGRGKLQSNAQDGPFGQVRSYQGNSNRAELETDYAPGQGKLESHAQPGQRVFSQDANNRSSQNGFFGQAPSQSDFDRAKLEFDYAYGRRKL